MRYIKKFNENLLEKSIEDWCKHYLESYIINDDGTVDVDGDVDISSGEMLSIPIQFGIVDGYFTCGENNLTSLEGCPKIVKDVFSCSYNQLTNLIGGPIEVVGDYFCRNNKLMSLEGYPENLDGVFYCGGNPIHEIYKLFNYDYKAYKASLDYNYLRGTNIIKHRFGEALEEVGVMEIPEYIEGYKYI